MTLGTPNVGPACPFRGPSAELAPQPSFVYIDAFMRDAAWESALSQRFYRVD